MKNLVVCCKCGRCSVEFCCLVLTPMVEVKKLVVKLKMYVAYLKRALVQRLTPMVRRIMLVVKLKTSVVQLKMPVVCCLMAVVES